MRKRNQILLGACIVCSLISMPLMADTYQLNSKGDTVTKIQEQLKERGLFHVACTGHYGEITRDAVIVFQKNNGLDMDGMVGHATYTALFGKSEYAEIMEGVETLDWFKEVEKIFPRGGKATLRDVKTGKSFQLQRSYGTNHADVEPLTAEDTRVMREIWGGESWAKRPVVIETNGRKLMASANGMPHAGLENKPANITVNNRSGNFGTGLNLDMVKGNQMNGHFCVHFLNSRTHGSNKVDGGHQSNIKKTQ